MIVWMFTIVGPGRRIVTQNSSYAEKRSKLGDIVFCKRETNMYKHN